MTKTSTYSDTPFPRPRTLVHPGRFNPIRIQSLDAQQARHIRLLLEPGQSLYDALVGPLADIGIGSASTTILGGGFDALTYCVAPPDLSGKSVIAYGKPLQAGRAFMIFGNATLGKAVDGAPLVHCHAAIRTENGTVKGGHLITERCIVGETPIPVLVTCLAGFELRQAHDPETNMLLLQPRKVALHG